MSRPRPHLKNNSQCTRRRVKEPRLVGGGLARDPPDCQTEPNQVSTAPAPTPAHGVGGIPFGQCICLSHTWVVHGLLLNVTFTIVLAESRRSGRRRNDTHHLSISLHRDGTHGPPFLLMPMDLSGTVTQPITLLFHTSYCEFLLHNCSPLEQFRMCDLLTGKITQPWEQNRNN